MSVARDKQRISESFNYQEMLSDTDVSEDYDNDPMYREVIADLPEDDEDMKEQLD